MSLILPFSFKSSGNSVPITTDGIIYETLISTGNGNTYIFGTFDSIQSQPRPSAASFSTSGVLTNFNLGQPTLDPVYAATETKYQLDDSYQIAIGINSGIKLLNLTTGASLSTSPVTNINGAISTLFNDPNSYDIYSLGGFTIIDGLGRYGIAKWNGNLSFNRTWRFNPTGGFPSCIANASTTHIYVGGSFTSPRQKLARVRKSDGVLDTSFTPNTPNSKTKTVFSIAVSANGNVLEGGLATTNNLFFKCLNSSGTEISNLSSLIYNQVNKQFLQVEDIIINNEKIYTYIGLNSQSTTEKLGWIFKFNSDLSIDTSFNSPSGYISLTTENKSYQPTIKIGIDQNNNLVVGGAVDKIGGTTTSSGYAILDNTTGSVLVS